MSIEDRLADLVSANEVERRYDWPRKWKSAGPVAAILCSYVPREIVYAAGFLPWRVTGSWDGSPVMAQVHRAAWTSPKNTRILELVLRGELDFADAVIGTDWDIDLKRLWDEWTILRKPKAAEIMFIPRYTSEIHLSKMRDSIAKLLLTLEQASGKRVGTHAIEEAVGEYRHMRGLVRKLYELRKRPVPAISGAEVLGITTASTVMPPREFNSRLEALLPLLEDRKVQNPLGCPRVLVTGDFLDNPRYIKLVEECGCVVAMDDLDTGSRMYWSRSETGISDPLLALATEYLRRPGCPRMADWEGQVQQLADWVQEFNIDGVLELRLNFSMSRQLRSPLVKSALEAKGVPFISVPIEYQFANEEQLRTRVGAFLELVGD
ncbi:MAG: 2-hydroxyacyl-CoA dehydratase [Chloroflexi bacterium]|nr:2-hydroxyacyl-CoA dehydratase [Chloroflexota bacterium]